MCSVDWGLLSGVITAIATAFLAVGSVFTAVYAYRAAQAANRAAGAANKTLSLESEPVLMLSVADGVATNQRWNIVEIAPGHLGPLPATGAEMSGTGYFAISNLGRSPAMKVTAKISIVTEGQGQPLIFTCYISSLVPNERYVVAFHNATFRPIEVGSAGATRASIANGGAVENCDLFASTAVPFTLAPG